MFKVQGSLLKFHSFPAMWLHSPGTLKCLCWALVRRSTQKPAACCWAVHEWRCLVGTCLWVRDKRLFRLSGCLCLVLGTEEQELLFKARNWEIKYLLYSVPLPCEAAGCSLPVLDTAGFKPNGKKNLCCASHKAESIILKRLRAVSD